MSDPSMNFGSGGPGGVLSAPPSSRISVAEVARRLNIGRSAVYSMLEQGIVPGIRLGRRWILTRFAYEQWERSCGTRVGAGLRPQPEVTVN